MPFAELSSCEEKPALTAGLNRDCGIGSVGFFDNGQFKGNIGAALCSANSRPTMGGRSLHEVNIRIHSLISGVTAAERSRMS